jgi:hypothetical protein
MIIKENNARKDLYFALMMSTCSDVKSFYVLCSTVRSIFQAASLTNISDRRDPVDGLEILL